MCRICVASKTCYGISLVCDHLVERESAVMYTYDLDGAIQRIRVFTILLCVQRLFTTAAVINTPQLQWLIHMNLYGSI